MYVHQAIRIVYFTPYFVLILPSDLIKGHIGASISLERICGSKHSSPVWHQAPEAFSYTNELIQLFSKNDKKHNIHKFQVNFSKDIPTLIILLSAKRGVPKYLKIISQSHAHMLYYY